MWRHGSGFSVLWSIRSGGPSPCGPNLPISLCRPVARGRCRQRGMVRRFSALNPSPRHGPR